MTPELKEQIIDLVIDGADDGRGNPSTDHSVESGDGFIHVQLEYMWRYNNIIADIHLISFGDETMATDDEVREIENEVNERMVQFS